MKLTQSQRPDWQKDVIKKLRKSFKLFLSCHLVEDFISKEIDRLEKRWAREEKEKNENT